MRLKIIMLELQSSANPVCSGRPWINSINPHGYASYGFKTSISHRKKKNLRRLSVAIHDDIHVNHAVDYQAALMGARQGGIFLIRPIDKGDRKANEKHYPGDFPCPGSETLLEVRPTIKDHITHKTKEAERPLSNSIGFDKSLSYPLPQVTSEFQFIYSLNSLVCSDSLFLALGAFLKVTFVCFRGGQSMFFPSK